MKNSKVDIKPESRTKRDWYSRNRERYNRYMREYMREYRARKDREAATVHGDVQHGQGPQEGQG
jgi:thiamine kinase-like enzyme